MNMDKTTEELVSHLQLRGNFNNQVTKILSSVQMCPVQLKSLEILYEDIQHTFSKTWPGCTVKPFGSSKMNLALKNSDVDCFLELPAGYGESPERCVQKCLDLIVNSVTPFREASVIQAKKVPIVQFCHATTGQQCDLSFNKPIAVEFAKLVKYMLTLDHRALKLAILIKCWAKIQKLTGKKRLPSNALVILVIFFLQYKKILPSVAMLQDNSTHIIDDWNTGFVELLYKSNNCESVYNLLGQSFAYYSMFDFNNYIVSPYLGYSLEKRQFCKLDNVPEAFEMYKKNVNENVSKRGFFLYCTMCIQDPFEHARNCAGPVRPEVVKEIIHHLQTSWDLHATTSKNGFLSKLLSFEYSKPLVMTAARNKNTGRSRVCRRGTPRSRAFRARFRHPKEKMPF